MNPCDDALEFDRLTLLILGCGGHGPEGFSCGRIHGTTHTAIGQEADAVGVFAGSQPGDAVLSNHRGHGDLP